MKTQANDSGNVKTGLANESWVGLICHQVSSVRFGVMQIVVHESHLEQIERNEKLRLNPPGSMDRFAPCQTTGGMTQMTGAN